MYKRQVYDGRVYSKVQMAVSSVRCIYQLMAARWKKNEKELQVEDIVELVYLSLIHILRTFYQTPYGQEFYQEFYQRMCELKARLGLE